jgi:hypothetical protein
MTHFAIFKPLLIFQKYSKNLKSANVLEKTIFPNGISQTAFKKFQKNNKIYNKNVRGAPYHQEVALEYYNHTNDKESQSSNDLSSLLFHRHCIKLTGMCCLPCFALLLPLMSATKILFKEQALVTITKTKQIGQQGRQTGIADRPTWQAGRPTWGSTLSSKGCLEILLSHKL